MGRVGRGCSGPSFSCERPCTNRLPRGQVRPRGHRRRADVGQRRWALLEEPNTTSLHALYDRPVTPAEKPLPEPFRHAKGRLPPAQSTSGVASRSGRVALLVQVKGQVWAPSRADGS